MINYSKINQSLSLLSGKGGSGKTVIALSMCQVLSQAGLKVLLIDLDTATHGATYFFESELEKSSDKIVSVSDLLYENMPSGIPLSTKSGFYFVPSTTQPQEIKQRDFIDPEKSSMDHFERYLSGLISDYEIIIFDCQAGYSTLSKWAVDNCKKNLLVLEADAVSSASIRVLFLQIGKSLKTTRTWQIINKLTEEERPIYEKVTGGTFFTNLPPIPFDWQVRASFAISEIPSVTTKGSAFGLGVLRLMKTIFPNFSEKLDKLENKTVGLWYREIADKLEKLQIQKEEIMYKKIEGERKRRVQRVQNISVFLTLFAILITILNYTISITKYLGYIISGFIVLGVILWQILTIRDIRAEREQDTAQESLSEIEKEIARYKTLFTTDPRLREFIKDTSNELFNRNNNSVSDGKQIA